MNCVQFDLLVKATSLSGMYVGTSFRVFDDTSLRAAYACVNSGGFGHKSKLAFALRGVNTSGTFALYSKCASSAFHFRVEGEALLRRGGIVAWGPQVDHVAWSKDQRSLLKTLFTGISVRGIGVDQEKVRSNWFELRIAETFNSFEDLVFVSEHGLKSYMRTAKFAERMLRAVPNQYSMRLDSKEPVRFRDALFPNGTVFWADLIRQARAQ